LNPLTLRQNLDAAVVAFRVGMEASGSERLAGFIDCLTRQIVMYPPQVIAELQPLLNELMAAQARRDYTFVADLLEYPLSTLLNQAT